MAEIKFVINDPKTGKSYQKVLEENPFLNRKFGDKVKGNDIGLDGYDLEIRGGSDKSGCPIRPDMPGSGKKKALLTGGPCAKGLKKGKRIRKTVVGSTIDKDIVQVNLKILKQGSKKIEEIFPPKEDKKKEGESPKKEEAPKKEEKPKVEEKKPEPKKEEKKPEAKPKKEEPKTDKPASN